MQFPVLLIVLISALVFRANCREYIDEPDHQEASPIHQQYSSGGLLNPDFFGEENYTSDGLDRLESFEENPLTFGVDQQLEKDLTEQRRIELRGNSGKGSIKKLIKSLESMERKLTMANQELKMELQAIKEHQANISNINTEIKTDLQYIGAVITNNTAILESIQDCNSNLVTTSVIYTTTPRIVETTGAPSTTTSVMSPTTTTTTTTNVAPSTTTTEIPVPAGFERFNGRVIRRTLSSDPKSNYDDAMAFCNRYSAKPFIPRSSDDYQLYEDVRNSLGRSGYMWLPANDRQQEGTLRWEGGELVSENTLWDWYKGEQLSLNSESDDCLFYGCCQEGNGDSAVYMRLCSISPWYPPICERI